MTRREEEIGELVLFISKKSRSWTQPRLVVIGGYALRVFVPFSRYSRDCDFVLKEGLDTVKAWKPATVRLEELRREDGYGFMRWSKPFGAGKTTVKLGLEFLEGQVRSRGGEAFTISDRFLASANEAEIAIAGKPVRVLVPSYADFLVLKVMAARRSDVRDVAALVWKNGVPDVSASLADLNDPDHLYGHLERKIVPEIESKNFLNSWRGTFLTEEFKDDDRKDVVEALRRAIE